MMCHNAITHHIYDWNAPCPHSVVLDLRGNRVSPEELDRPGARGVRVHPPYACPACARPDESHIYFLTRPRIAETHHSTRAKRSEPPPASYATATASLSSRPGPHKHGFPCPDGDARCHWHHSDANPCHKHWQQCKLAST